MILLKKEIAEIVNIVDSILRESKELKIDDVNDIKMVSVVDRDKYQERLEAAKEEKLAIEMILEEANWGFDLRGY